MGHLSPKSQSPKSNPKGLGLTLFWCACPADHASASLLGVTGHLMYQIRTLDINNKFTSNQWVGLTVFLGLSLGMLKKEKNQDPISVQEIVEAARVVNIEETR